MTGKAINQRDRKGMQVVPYKLYFSAEDSFINMLNPQLPKTL